MNKRFSLQIHFLRLFFGTIGLMNLPILAMAKSNGESGSLLQNVKTVISIVGAVALIVIAILFFPKIRFISRLVGKIKIQNVFPRFRKKRLRVRELGSEISMPESKPEKSKSWEIELLMIKRRIDQVDGDVAHLIENMNTDIQEIKKDIGQLNRKIIDDINPWLKCLRQGIQEVWSPFLILKEKMKQLEREFDRYLPVLADDKNIVSQKDEALQNETSQYLEKAPSVSPPPAKKLLNESNLIDWWNLTEPYGVSEYKKSLKNTFGNDIQLKVIKRGKDPDEWMIIGVTEPRSPYYFILPLKRDFWWEHALEGKSAYGEWFVLEEEKRGDVSLRINSMKSLALARKIGDDLEFVQKGRLSIREIK